MDAKMRGEVARAWYKVTAFPFDIAGLNLIFIRLTEITLIAMISYPKDIFFFPDTLCRA